MQHCAAKDCTLMPKFDEMAVADQEKADRIAYERKVGKRRGTKKGRIGHDEDIIGNEREGNRRRDEKARKG